MEPTPLRTGKHPGSTFAVILRSLKRPKSEIARMLGISRQSLYDILAGKQAVTATVALRIARLTCTRAEMWIELQGAYDLAIARRNSNGLLDDIPRLASAW